MRELQRQRSWREADVARTIQVYIKGPVARYRSHQDHKAHQLQQNQQKLQGASSSMHLPASQTGPSSHQMGAQVAGSFIQDPNNPTCWKSAGWISNQMI
ncbi:hypothetical protein KIW84_022131 [Lathyrus oleraceus]|uniref:Uncharacterized protein n=1 Tax=Pisum sativum TaxID=3888 RepID=A0A9D4YBS3_PEA|nr:hypothetical protein KIW84_022131 [Pisum sativum]